MKKTAVVVGATGLVGSELVSQLIKSNQINNVITLSRRPLGYTSDKLINHIVEFDSLDQYRELIKGDLLFSCLGTTRKQAGSIKAQRRVDFDYQLQVAVIASENNVQHYLLVSSSGANAHSLSAYLRMKGELEQSISKLNFKQISIFQPSLLVGDRAKSRFAEELGTRIMPVLCHFPWLKKFQPVQGVQVAKKMLAVSLTEGVGLNNYRLDAIFDS